MPTGPERSAAESAPNIDFLNPDVKFVLALGPRLSHGLPEVMDADDDDPEQLKIRYGILAGRFTVESPTRVKIHLDEGCDLDPDETNTRPTHGNTLEQSIDDIRAQVIKMDLRSPESDVPLELIGDIHTHPGNRAENWRLLQLTEEDTKALVAKYTSGELDGDHPFIVGISAQQVDLLEPSVSEPDYAFYRLVKKGDEYVVENLEL